VRQETVLARLRAGGLVVVARRLERQHAGPVADSLVGVGAPALELTLDEPTAIESIAEIHRQLSGQLLIGAGTVLQATDAKRAIAAGADFLVSPVYIPSILRLCRESNVLYIPGAASPTDIFRILKSGTKAVKLFPASLMTPSYIRDVLEPFRNYDPVFMLTGGLGTDQIASYIEAGVAMFGVGKAILDPAALMAGQYGTIGTRAQQILKVIRAPKK
jgi:2-dehydro-3-deoxyphosphogluconate aldolase / (4S)-4-hydroxy-2-oxoglutarate aldolase